MNRRKTRKRAVAGHAHLSCSGSACRPLAASPSALNARLPPSSASGRAAVKTAPNDRGKVDELGDELGTLPAVRLPAAHRQSAGRRHAKRRDKQLDGRARRQRRWRGRGTHLGDRGGCRAILRRAHRAVEGDGPAGRCGATSCPPAGGWPLAASAPPSGASGVTELLSPLISIKDQVPPCHIGSLIHVCGT